MSQPVSKGRGEKPPKRPLLPLLAAALVFFLLIAVATYWQIRALINKPTPAVALATEPSVKPDSSALGPKLGGVIKNEQGQPVADALVTLTYELQGSVREEAYRNLMAQRPPNLPALNMDTFRPYKSAATTTDSAGRFSTTRVPSDSLGGLRLAAQQSEYATLTVSKPSLPQLIDQSANFVLTRGVDVNGIVVNDQGLPIAGAQITDRQTVSGRPLPVRPDLHGNALTTSADGRFTIRHLPPNAFLELGVSMPGFGTVGQHVTLPLKDELRIVLSPAREITGRVIDHFGTPIPNAAVSMGIPMGGPNPPPDMSTDAQGVYHFFDAPQGQVGISASKQGYLYSYVTAEPNQAPPAIELRKQIVFSGMVTDAVTHQPIQQFTVYCGGSGLANLPPIFNNPSSFTDGKYSMPVVGFSSLEDAYYGKIEAKGYAAAISDPQTESATANFQLQPNDGGHSNQPLNIPDTTLSVPPH